MQIGNDEDDKDEDDDKNNNNNVPLFSFSLNHLDPNTNRYLKYIMKK